ncbi:MAG: stage II sporulation protein P [bacterium]
MNKLLGVLVLFFLLIFTQIGWAELEKENGYYTMSDGKNIILQTGIKIGPGDVFYDSEDREYRVKKMEGKNALVEQVRQKQSCLTPFERLLTAQVMGFGGRIAQNKTDRPIVIYHTHSDESYEPSEGTHSVSGQGGIFKVGAAMAKGYEEAGITVKQSYTTHEPHDGMAYDRSRRTATQLMQQNPLTEFDVHRDAAEREQYAKEINGREIAQVLFVIGNQNPNYQTNLEYAKELKETANSRYPGLSKGVLVTSGKFNQDLSPNNLLLEFGGHKNTRESAEATASLFAAATADAVLARGGIKSGNSSQDNGITRTAAEGQNKAVGSSLVYWIVGILLVGGAFFLIDERRWEAIKTKTKRLQDEHRKNKK